MPPKRVIDQPENGGYDLAAINDRLDQIVRDSQSSSQTRDDHVIVLEHRFQGAEANINELKGQSEVMLQSINGIQVLLRDMASQLPEKQVETGNGSQTGPRSDRNANVGDNDDGVHVPSREYQDQNHPKVFMPRVDLPVFDGNRAASWLEHCKLYFEVNQTPEHYKTRLATLSFTGDAAEWYECYGVEHPNPSWPVLVEAVFERFKVRNNVNPVIQFKKVKQEGDVACM